jgi:hypothetical protein
MNASGINVKFLSINSKAYDVSKLELGLGQDIEMDIPELLGSDVKWFADNDAVLKISASGNLATITALEVGTSIIQVQGYDFGVLKSITIEVVSEPASTLGLKAGTPVMK